MEDDSKQKQKKKKPKEEYKTKILFSTSLIFNQDIDELWLFLRNKENTVKIIDKFVNPKLFSYDKYLFLKLHHN